MEAGATLGKTLGEFNPPVRSGLSVRGPAKSARKMRRNGRETWTCLAWRDEALINFTALRLIVVRNMKYRRSSRHWPLFVNNEKHPFFRP